MVREPTLDQWPQSGGQMWAASQAGATAGA